MKRGTLVTLSNEVENNQIHGIANSLTKTRSGITVTQSAGEKVIGQSVPLLMAHNWQSLPIGSAKMVGVDENGLSYEGNIFESVEQKEQILEGIKAGVLSVSIGFGIDDIGEDGTIDGIDLLELSLTPVPADSKATVTQALQIEEDINLKTRKLDDTTNQQPTGDTTDQTPKDSGNDTTEPTIQDVLDAISAIAGDISDIKKALTPPDNKGDQTDTSPTTESLKDANVKLLNFIDSMELSFSKMVELKRIKKEIDK